MKIHEYQPDEIDFRNNYLQVGYETWQKAQGVGLYTEFSGTQGIIAAHNPSDESVWLGAFEIPIVNWDKFNELRSSMRYSQSHEEISLWLGGAPTLTSLYGLEGFDPEDDEEIAELLKETNEEVIPRTRGMIVDQLGNYGLNLSGAEVKWLDLDQQFETVSLSRDGLLRYSIDDI